MTTDPVTIERPPLCIHCNKSVKPCAPCCRHSGWLHRRDDGHLCDPHNPAGTMAMPNSVLYSTMTKPSWT